MLGPPRVNHEQGHEHDARDHWDEDRRGHQAPGRFALGQAIGDPHGAGGGEHEPDHVEAPGLRAARGVVGEQPQREGQGEDSHRHVDEEDPLPPDALQEQAAEGRTEDGGKHHGNADEAHDLGQVAGTGGLDEDHLADRRQHSASDALEHAEEDQLPARGGQRTQTRTQREDDEGDEVEASRAEAPHRPAGDRNDRGEREQVAGDDPLDALERGMEIAGEIVERDVDDRRVEHRHDQSHDHHDRDSLDMGLDARGLGGGGCLSRSHLIVKD
jgi:hypothetical protein